MFEELSDEELIKEIKAHPRKESNDSESLPKELQEEPYVKKEEPEKSPEQPKNDSFNEYEYSDDPDGDDKEW